MSPGSSLDRVRGLKDSRHSLWREEYNAEFIENLSLDRSNVFNVAELFGGE